MTRSLIPRRFIHRQRRTFEHVYRTRAKTSGTSSTPSLLPPKPKPKVSTTIKPTTSLGSANTSTPSSSKESAEDQALAFLAERARSAGSPLSLEERKLILKEAGFHQHGRLKQAEWNRLVSNRGFADQERLTLNAFIAKSHDGILGQRLLQNTARLGIGFFAMCAANIAGSEADFHIMGATLVGCVTALGGGTVNGLVTGATPVGWVRDPSFLLITVGASCLGFYVWPLVEEALEVDKRSNADTYKDEEMPSPVSNIERNKDDNNYQIQEPKSEHSLLWYSLESAALGALAIVGVHDPSFLIFTLGASWLGFYVWPLVEGALDLNTRIPKPITEEEELPDHNYKSINEQVNDQIQDPKSHRSLLQDPKSDQSLLRYSLESVALGALAVVGAQQGIVRGLHPLVSASLGVTITMGGVMRDLMCQRDLTLGAATGCQSYGIASFAGAAVYVALRQLHVWNCAGNTSKLLTGGIPLTMRVLLGFSTVFGIRAVAWHYKPDRLLLTMEESAILNQQRIQTAVQKFSGG